jgi:hypothetical protein
MILVCENVKNILMAKVSPARPPCKKTSRTPIGQLQSVDFNILIDKCLYKSKGKHISYGYLFLFTEFLALHSSRVDKRMEYLLHSSFLQGVQYPPVKMNPILEPLPMTTQSSVSNGLPMNEQLLEGQWGQQRGCID